MVVKEILIALILLIFGLSDSLGQSIQYPKVDNQTTDNVIITEVKITSTKTKISFRYYNGTPDSRQYFYLHAPGNPDALYIKAKGKIYKLLSTENIANKDGITFTDYKQSHYFTAYFEKLPSDITKFDLIEGAAGSWDFYGVSMISSNDLEDDESPKKFRIDYRYMAFYEAEKETWSEWMERDNTFVINVNQNGDIAHFLPNGKIVIYKKISGVEKSMTSKGKQYQIIKALDDDGNIVSIQLFDDSELGLKIMYENLIIQFAKENN